MQLLYVEFKDHFAYQLKLIIYCNKPIALMLTMLEGLCICMHSFDIGI